MAFSFGMVRAGRRWGNTTPGSRWGRLSGAELGRPYRPPAECTQRLLHESHLLSVAFPSSVAPSRWARPRGGGSSGDPPPTFSVGRDIPPRGCRGGRCGCDRSRGRGGPAGGGPAGGGGRGSGRHRGGGSPLLDQVVVGVQPRRNGHARRAAGCGLRVARLVIPVDRVDAERFVLLVIGR